MWVHKKLNYSSCMGLLLFFGIGCADQKIASSGQVNTRHTTPTNTVPHVTVPTTQTIPSSRPTTSWQEFQVPAQELESAFAHKNDYVASMPQIEERYKFNNLIQSESKSGSKIYSVTLKDPPNEKRIFKILQQFIDNPWDHAGFKEIYFSQRLSTLGSQALLPAGQSASIFFPKYYGFGFVGSPDPFNSPNNPIQNQYYPFYVMEQIQGMTLQDFVEKPAQAEKVFGYSYESAPSGVIFSILFQLGAALLNANLEFGFLHNDLHPENIFLTTRPIAMNFYWNNNQINLKGPLVKIIDFDQGESAGHKPTTGRAFKTLGRQILGIVGPTEDFYKFINPDDSWRILALRCYWYSPNMDMFMLNILVHTFKKHFLREGLDVSDKYFASLRDFIDFLGSNAHKFGLAAKA